MLIDHDACFVTAVNTKMKHNRKIVFATHIIRKMMHKK